MQIASCRKGRQTKRRSRSDIMLLESLEQRQMLSLLGVLPNVPAIAYAGGGGLTYTASTKAFVADSTPVAIIFPDGTVDPVNDPTDLSLNISVNNDGSLAGSGMPRWI